MPNPEGENLTTGLNLLDPQKFSDEDIDSDLASVPSSPAREDSGINPTREAVAKTASVLAAGLPAFHSSRTSTGFPDEFLEEIDKPNEDEADGDLDNTDGSEDEIDADPTILANITAAATKRNLTHGAARNVDPETADSVTAKMPSHPEMLGRILKTLRPSDSDKSHVVPSLPSLERKVSQLHTDRKKRLPVPLPAVVSARLERTTAYKKARDQLTSKWKHTVLHNRHADQLSFPMDDPQLFTSTTDISSRPPSQRPGASRHELEIEQILREAGVDSTGHAERTENAAVDDALLHGKISEEDVLRRRRELAHMRSLAFHYDQKMKRIKKIKSKKYRRIMKKERERLAEGDAAGDSNAEREEEVEAERRRVEERVTLRHKNTSKWVRRQLQRGEAKKDGDTRAAIEEQLRLHEELKQRQQKEVGDGRSDDDESPGGSDAGEAPDEGQLESLRLELQNENLESNVPDAKGVMSLRFMQAAMERKRQHALRMVDEAQAELHKKDNDNEMVDSDVCPESPRSPNSTMHRVASVLDGAQDEGGLDVSLKDQEIDQLERRVRDEYDDAAASGLLKGRAEGAVDLDSAASIIKATGNAASTFTTRLDGRLTTDETNPWLKDIVFETGQSGGTDKVGNKSTTEFLAQKDFKTGKVEVPLGSENCANVSKPSVPDSGHSDKSQAVKKADSQLCFDSKTFGDGEDGKGVASLEVKRSLKRRKKRNVPKTTTANVSHNLKAEQSGTALLNAEKPSTKGNALSSSTSQKSGTLVGSTERKPTQESETRAGSKKRKHFDRSDTDDLAKMEGIAQAFAGAGGADLDEFEAAKQTDIQESLPTAKSLHAEVLPGWGQWHGAGMTEGAKKRANETPFARAARQRLADARKNVVQSRSDRNMRNVILEQKRYQSATKLTVGFVPYPFQSREQWERELSRPLCRELVSNKSFRTGVERRVETKLGKVINPINAPLPTPEDSFKQGVPVNHGRGKKAVIDLRKQKSSHRVKTRRDFLS